MYLPCRHWLLCRFIISIVFVCTGTFGVIAANAEGANTEVLVARVLLKADAAFSAKRYTQPQYNNAFDRYNAVLMIAPDNQHAKRGLQLILQRYIALANDELEFGSVHHALTFLAIIDENYSRELAAAASGRTGVFALTAEHNRAVAALRARVAKHQKVQPPQDFNDLLIKVYALDASALSAKNTKARQALEQIAARVANTDEAVLIHARNDKEGRWIYQTLNSATPTYRVRGDIRLAKKPAIHLLAPL